MDLEKLQSKGAIHIGRKSGRMVLYAYVIDSSPGRIALGWTRSEVVVTHEAGADEARIAGAPVIKDVVDRTEGRARFLMICHHSSAKELRDKIHAALAVKEMASTTPEGIDETDEEVWLSARLEDVVFAYPPFAKIFLSEVPTFAEERGGSADDDAVQNNAPPQKVRAGAFLFGRQQGADEDEERRNRILDALLFRSAGMRSFASLLMLLAIIFGSAFLVLERLKATEEGRAWLMSVETMIGFSFGADGERGLGFLTRAELELRRSRGEDPGEFVDWYDPARTDDAGSTFGMPREHQGFYIKTWVDGEEGNRNLYAAYRFNPETAWQGETEEQDRVSREMMNDLLRVPNMVEDLHLEACRTLSGEASSLAAEEFQKVEVVVVHDQDIIAAFAANEGSCARGAPKMRKMGES